MELKDDIFVHEFRLKNLERKNAALLDLLKRALPYLVDYQHLFEGDTIEDLNMLSYFIENVEKELAQQQADEYLEAEGAHHSLEDFDDT